MEARKAILNKVCTIKNEMSRFLLKLFKMTHFKLRSTGHERFVPVKLNPAYFITLLYYFSLNFVKYAVLLYISTVTELLLEIKMLTFLILLFPETSKAKLNYYHQLNNITFKINCSNCLSDILNIEIIAPRNRTNISNTKKCSSIHS